MQYTVIQYFTDLQDGRHPYNVGDVFPREGTTVTDERLQELSTTANRRGVPLIRAVEERTPKAPRTTKGTKKKQQ